MTPEQGIEQAEVMRRWHEQRSLPEDQRDILEFKSRQMPNWTEATMPSWDFSLREYRLRKRPRQKTVTVYLHHDGLSLFSSLRPGSTKKPLGQADITYEETDDDAR